VPFDDIARPLARVVEETVSSPDVRIRFEVVGDAGELRGEMATPLAVVLNELMQNAADHAYPRPEGHVANDPIVGHVRVVFDRRDDELRVDVVDDGVGLPLGFSLERSSGLGLSIVHTLVTSELGGSIEMCDEGGTRVTVRVPLTPELPAELY